MVILPDPPLRTKKNSIKTLTAENERLQTGVQIKEITHLTGEINSIETLKRKNNSENEQEIAADTIKYRILYLQS